MCIYVYVLLSLLALTDLLYSAGRFWYWRLALSFFSILSAVNVFVLSFFCGSVLVHCCSVPACAMIIGNVHACHGAAVPLVLNDTFH